MFLDYLLTRYAMLGESEGLAFSVVVKWDGDKD